jgi:quercetin dioxygenase-like cupin family protein
MEKMKNITAVLRLEPAMTEGKDKDASVIFNGPRRQLLEIKLQNGAVLSKHRAAEPITVLCISGSGRFFAGEDLDESVEMSPGTLVTLEPNIQHEVAAEPNIHILVTKFKEN